MLIQAVLTVLPQDNTFIKPPWLFLQFHCSSPIHIHIADKHTHLKKPKQKSWSLSKENWIIINHSRRIFNVYVKQIRPRRLSSFICLISWGQWNSLLEEFLRAVLSLMNQLLGPSQNENSLLMQKTSAFFTCSFPLLLWDKFWNSILLSLLKFISTFWAFQIKNYYSSSPQVENLSFFLVRPDRTAEASLDDSLSKIQQCQPETNSPSVRELSST